MFRTRRRWLLSAAAALLAVPCAAQVPAPSPPPAAPEDAVPNAPVVVRVFGNTNWESRREDLPNSFILGQVDVFATSQLAPGLTALTEVVFEASGNSEVPDSQVPVAEVERFQVRYAPADAFSVSLGRMHTVLGYWNQTYHHGTWLQTTIQRPEVYRFEDDEGGFLPVHEVGLRLSGSASLSPMRVEYSASLVNGRAPRASQVATLQDANDAKAVYLWLALKPRFRPGLQLGGTAVFDTIPPLAGASGREGELSERILGGFAVYQGLRLEVLAEAFNERHRAVDGTSWSSNGGYAQGAVALGRYKPYYRFDLVRRDEGDPFLEATRDIARHTAGLRVDPWRLLCLKLEFAHGDLGHGSTFNAAAVQAAFTF